MKIPSQLTARPSAALKGRVRAPGDKSMSHRALILGGLATGVTEIDGLLEGEDILATARAVQAFGATVRRLGERRWRVEGRGGFRTPTEVIDCGNAGTGVRLLMGAAAGQPVTATFDGDASLRKRPMKRVTDPLSAMGARFAWLTAEDRLPATVQGGALAAIDHVQTVASAQIKSAVLLAALTAEGVTTVVESERSRDHTERMLRAFGAEVEVVEEGEGWRISLRGGQTLKGTAVAVPGDPSSAAFPLAAGLIVPGSEVTVEGVMLNPLRTGLFDTWIEMGADLTLSNRRHGGGEEIADVTARHSRLKGVVVPEARAASMIDEYPILAATAAFAEGRTVMRGVGEMRVKESDRIRLMVDGLRACGVAVDEEAEGFIVTGGPVLGGATVATAHDHRIAMSHLVLGLAAQAPVSVMDPEMIATSFPDFVALMRGLGAKIGEAPAMRERISSGSAFEAEIGYSRAVIDGDWVFVSGTTGFDYATMTISEDVADQTRRTLANIEAALVQARCGFADVVRVRYILPDAADFPACWPALRAAFGEARPAATMIQAGLADSRMKIEIEVTARRPAS